MFKEVISGFFVKLITGLDDTITHVPVITSLTRTKRGRIAFAFGILLAITLAIILSFSFASLIKSFSYYNYVAAAIIFILAISIYFNLLFPKLKKKTQTKLKKAKKPISAKKIAKLMGIGFITAFVTVIDDSLAYSSVFLILEKPVFVILGIYIATILQLAAIIYFSKKIQKIPYKRQISAAGLLILGTLILFKII